MALSNEQLKEDGKIKWFVIISCKAKRQIKKQRTRKIRKQLKDINKDAPLLNRFKGWVI